MVDTNTVIEGNVKFRDGRKWKSRWGVMRKLSPVADCLHLQLYRDSKDRYKQGQTKASLSLQHFLGVQSGFTLDKESNTIAIICQDVTVVLAFDTRERLIQWQVKIANNLGEDEQFLVQVSSGPQRAKLAPGPALLHVLERQFCLTVGVPPRLVGCWQINQLRRYGVVESRFCFEGGSRCGKGEGLYVLVTDQGDEITRTFRLAAEGKLSSKKRPASRNASDSPKKSSHGRPDTRLSDLSGLEVSGGLPLTAEFPTVEENCCSCTCGHDEFGWPTADLTADFADASSVADFLDPHIREGLWPGEAGMERCASCISKLGALSRSSTAAVTPNTSFTPAWTMEANPAVKLEQTRSAERSNGSSTANSQAFMNDDCSAGNRSGPACWSSKQNQNASGMERCACCPPARPPKPGHLSSQPHKSSASGSQPQKSPANSSPKKKQNVPTGSTSCACSLTVNPYDNYDIPKVPQGFACSKDQNCHWFQNPLAGEPEFYDTPKNIKENIATEFGNYDTPPPALVERKQMCTSLQKNQFLTRVMLDNEDMHMVACPCQRMLCWAENWMFFPYCRRGNGRENTVPPTLHKKVTQCGGQVLLNNLSTVYATVDKSKKIRNRQVCEDQRAFDKFKSTSSEALQNSKEPSDKSNDDRKISNEKSDQDSTGVNVNIGETEQNYMNFDFVKSLEFYENSKDLMQKSSQIQKENNKIYNESKSVGTNTTPETPDNPGIKICTKCRHECKWPAPNPRGKQDDYLMMEPSGLENSIKTCDQQTVSSCGSHVPGYLPMHPIGGPSPISSQDLFKLKMYQQQMMSGNERAASSPSLTDHNITERCRRRSDVEMHRIPGSAMFGFNQSISAANSPYLRRRVLGCLHESSESEINSMVSRKRSCSADSANNLKELRNPTYKSVLPCHSSGDDEHYKSYGDNVHSPKVHPKKFVDFNMETTTLDESERNVEKRNVETRIPSMHLEPSVCKDMGQYENVQSMKSNQNEPLVHVRRSSSAPSKSNHNRDSSSSNDSGVSSCSLKKKGEDFTESDLKPSSSGMSRRYTYATTDKDLLCACFHSSLPRRSKSVDPLRDLAFQFQKVEMPMKSSSAEAEVPIFHAKRESRGCLSPGAAVPYMDSRSTSSGTSDMSDYFETLSLSSFSSSDTPDSLHFGHQAVCTMRPRSGKEYQKIDTILDTELKKIQQSTPDDNGEAATKQKEEGL